MMRRIFVFFISVIFIFSTILLFALSDTDNLTNITTNNYDQETFSLGRQGATASEETSAKDPAEQSDNKDENSSKYRITEMLARLIAGVPPDYVLYIIVLAILFFSFFRGAPQLIKLSTFGKRLSSTTKQIISKELLDWDLITKNLSELKYLVSEYKELLTGTTGNTQNCEIFLSEENIYRTLNVDETELEHYPGVFTALGIAGTFIGILFVLVPIVNPESGDFGNNRVIDRLLHGAGVAFLTSIIGIGASLIFLITQRRVVGSFKKKLYEFHIAINSRLNRITPESLLSGIKDAVETMADDIAASVSKTIASTLQAFEGVVSDSFLKAGQGSEEIVDKVLMRIDDTLNKFSDNIELFEVSSSIQTDVLKQFDRSVDNAVQLADKFEKILPPLNNAVRDIEKSSIRLEKLPDALADLTTFQKEFGEIVKEHLTVMEKSWQEEKERLTSLTTELNSRYSDFEEGITRGLQTTMSKFDDELSRAGTYIATWLDRLNEDVNKFETSLGTFQDSVSASSTAINKNIDDLNKVLNTYSKNFEEKTLSINQGLSEAFNNIKTQIEKVPIELEKTISKIQDIYELATDTIPSLLDDRLKKLADEIASSSRRGFTSLFSRK